MKRTVIILLLLVSGCACGQPQGSHKQRAAIYDDTGKVKEHVTIRGEHITIYDKDWKSKGYGTVKH